MKNIEIHLFNTVSYVEKLAFTKHLAVMVKSGISLAEAVHILMLQSEGSPLGKMLKAVYADINNGQALAVALAKFPKVFDDLYVSMIAVGEESGNLEENLNFLAEYMSKQDALRKKIQSALLYPSIVLIAAGLLSMGLGLFVLPQFVGFFDSFNVELPLSTSILLTVANFMKSYGVIFFISVISACVAFVFLLRSSIVKPYWHRVQLYIPIFGKIIRYSQLTNFSRNFGVLLSSGITATRALDTTANAATNLLYREKIKRMNSYLKQGKTLAEAIQNEMKQEFPVLVSRMIAVGEESGNLEDTLLYLSEFYENEIDVLTKRLTTVLEPILLLVIGLIVGFVALAIITPIYELTGSVRG